jgi:hypothetical protein
MGDSWSKTWHWDRFFSRYSSFILSVSIHQYSLLTHSTITGVLSCQQMVSTLNDTQNSYNSSLYFKFRCCYLQFSLARPPCWYRCINNYRTKRSWSVQVFTNGGPTTDVCNSLTKMKIAWYAKRISAQTWVNYRVAAYWWAQCTALSFVTQICGT